MNVNGDLCFQLVRKNTCDAIFIQRLLVGPEIVEPLYDPAFELLRDLPEIRIEASGSIPSDMSAIAVTDIRYD